MSAKVLALCESPLHGTGPEFVGLEHEVIGDVPDLDPFSSARFNVYVRARRIITEEQDAWATRWHPEAPPPHRLLTDAARPAAPSSEVWHINPPGDRSGENVARAWCAVAEYHRRRCFRAAWWVGFNLEQLSRLQRVGARSHPLQHATLVPQKRYGYRNHDTLKIAHGTNHASFLTLITRDETLIRRFAAIGSELGHVINGDRY